MAIPKEVKNKIEESRLLMEISKPDIIVHEKGKPVKFDNFLKSYESQNKNRVTTDVVHNGAVLDGRMGSIKPEYVELEKKHKLPVRKHKKQSNFNPILFILFAVIFYFAATTIK